MNAPTWARSLPWALILDKAKEHKLDPVLIAAIICEESGGITWRTRYEPNFEYILTPQVFAQRLVVTMQTEIQGQKHSHGLMQVMGVTAREHGFMGYFPELCADPAKGVHYGCKELVEKVDRYDGHLEKVIAAYNAGSARIVNGKYTNQSYVDKVLKLLARR